MAKWQDGHLIGRGGSAQVVEVTRLSDSRVFAKKILDSIDSEESIARFRAEVSILSSLNHPNIVKIEDYQLDEAPYWFVMRKYDRSLDAELEAIQQTPSRRIEIFQSVLAGVAYAHDNAIVHRDLKPSNILLADDGSVVVSDFGTSLCRKHGADRITATGQQIGTMCYASPEQWSDAKSVDNRSDIYNLGRILFEMHTGRLTSSVQQLDRLPFALQKVVKKCTEYDPELRYDSVNLLLQEWISAEQQMTSLDSGLSEAVKLLKSLSIDQAGSEAIRRLLAIIQRHLANDEFIRSTFAALSSVSIREMWRQDRSETLGFLRAAIAEAIMNPPGPEGVERFVQKGCGLVLAIDDSEIQSEVLLGIMTLTALRFNQRPANMLVNLLDSIPPGHLPRLVSKKLSSSTANSLKAMGAALDTSQMEREWACFFGY